MTDQIFIWILGIASTLFGGLNIFQWLTLKSYKRLKEAEADKTEISNLRETVETIQNAMQSEIDRLQKRVEKAEERADRAEERAQQAEQRAAENANKYLSLFEKHDALRTEFETYKQNHK